MSRAQVEHSTNTLVKYAHELYDASTRAFREHSHHNFDECVTDAMRALRLAKRLPQSPSSQDKYSVVKTLNAAALSLSVALVGQGRPEFHFSS